MDCISLRRTLRMIIYIILMQKLAGVNAGPGVSRQVSRPTSH